MIGLLFFVTEHLSIETTVTLPRTHIQHFWFRYTGSKRVTTDIGIPTPSISCCPVATLSNHLCNSNSRQKLPILTERGSEGKGSRRHGISDQSGKPQQHTCSHVLSHSDITTLRDFRDRISAISDVQRRIEFRYKGEEMRSYIGEKCLIDVFDSESGVTKVTAWRYST